MSAPEYTFDRLDFGGGKFIEIRRPRFLSKESTRDFIDWLRLCERVMSRCVEPDERGDEGCDVAVIQ